MLHLMDAIADVAAEIIIILSIQRRREGIDRRKEEENSILYARFLPFEDFGGQEHLVVKRERQIAVELIVHFFLFF